VKHTVKAFVYGFRVPGLEYILGLRQILMCLLHIPFSEIWEGMDQVKTLAMLEVTAAKMEKMEKTRQASSRYKE
jgi:hypothetical protein